MRKIKSVAFLAVGLILALSVKAYAISWEHNFKTALEKAKTDQRPLMVDFYTEWCGWCKKLDSDTYSDPKVGDISKNFICVKVDADKNHDDAAKYQIQGYPTIIFLDYEGNIAERVVGYRNAGDFADVMNSVLGKTKKPAAGNTKAAVPAPSRSKKSQFTLNGIIYDANAPGALINGKSVKVGDTVDGAIVKKITKSDVELEYNGTAVVLNIR